jgi:hypothetical protein
MGKKASLKLNLGYDLEDNNAFDVDWEDDLDCYKKKKEGSVQKVKTRVATTTATATSQPSIHGNRNSQFFSVKLFHKRPRGSPFSALLLLQGQDILLHVAQYLRLRSIASLSCSCRQVSQILSHESLYCGGQPDIISTGDEALLPCMRGMSLPKLAKPQLARRTAIESTIFYRQNGGRDRNFLLVESIHPPPDTTIHQCFLSKPGTRLFYLTGSGELITHIIPSTTKNVASCKGSNRNTATTTTQRIPGCNNVLSSAVSPDGSQCAILSMPGTGIRRYTLTLLQIGDKSKPPLWQDDIVPSYHLRSTKNSRPPSVQFHENWIVVVVTGQCSVFDAEQRALHWEFPLERHEQPWYAWTIHEDYIIALGGGSKKGLFLYDVRLQRLVGQGSLPPINTYSTVDLVQQAPQLVVCQDRIWLARYPKVICTGSILRRLRQRQSSQNTTSPHDGVLKIRKVILVTELSSRLPLLCCSGIGDHHNNKNDTILLADGNVIKIYIDGGNDEEGSSLWNNAPNGIQPSRIICAEGPIEHLRADSTKIICGIRDDKKRRMEILRLVDTANESSSLLEHSVFVKNAAVFLDRHTMDSVDYKVNSGKLLVVYASNRGDGSTKRTELRVFNLIDPNA